MPSELLAQGRAADVYAAGPGRVLRRYRDGEGGDVAMEAAATHSTSSYGARPDRAHGTVSPVPHANDELIQRFYEAFARLDGDTMATCYAPAARFSDPVFPDLRDGEPGAMWRMLTGRAQDLEVRLAEHEADEERGSAHWLADYTFSTGRRVHNDVRAEFRFEQGLIAEHRDSFSFYAWARQALGPAGVALGWTPIVRSKVRREARAGLDEFLARG